VPVADAFITWCHACGWNVMGGLQRHERRRRLDRGPERLASALDERVARELESTGSLEPRLTPAKAATYVIAGVVHLTTAALLAGSIVQRATR